MYIHEEIQAIDKLEREFKLESIAAAVAKEREACAKIVDSAKVAGLRTIVDSIADAIRSRSCSNFEGDD